MLPNFFLTVTELGTELTDWEVTRCCAVDCDNFPDDVGDSDSDGCEKLSLSSAVTHARPPVVPLITRHRVRHRRGSWVADRTDRRK